MLVPTTPWGVQEGVTVTERQEPRIFDMVGGYQRQAGGELMNRYLLLVVNTNMK